MRLDEGVDKYTQDNVYYCINRKAKKGTRRIKDDGGGKKTKLKEAKSAASFRSARNHFFMSSNIDTQAEESG